MVDSASNLPTEIPRGALISTVYAGREVKAYPVLESEVKSFAIFNTLEKIAFSAATGFVSAAVGIWVNASFNVTPTPEGAILSRFVAPSLCGVALIVVLAALVSIRFRSSVWSTILKESRSEPPSSGGT